MAPLKSALLFVPKQELSFEETLLHHKHAAVVRNPVVSGGKVVVTFESRPASRPFPGGMPFRSKVEGMLVKPILGNLSAGDIAALKRIHKPAGHRVVPLYDGPKMNGPFKGAFITKPVSAAKGREILEALKKQSQK